MRVAAGKHTGPAARNTGIRDLSIRLPSIGLIVRFLFPAAVITRLGGSIAVITRLGGSIAVITRQYSTLAHATACASCHR